MSCRTYLFDRVYIVRWEDPEMADVERVMREIGEAYRLLGRRLIFVAVASDRSRPPDAAVRKAFTEGNKILFQMCDAIHMVIEGQGIRSTVLRSVATSIFLLTGGRGKIFTHASLDEVLVGVEEDLGVRLPQLFRQAVGAG